MKRRGNVSFLKMKYFVLYTIKIFILKSLSRYGITLRFFKSIEKLFEPFFFHNELKPCLLHSLLGNRLVFEIIPTHECTRRPKCVSKSRECPQPTNLNYYFCIKRIMYLNTSLEHRHSSSAHSTRLGAKCRHRMRSP